MLKKLLIVSLLLGASNLFAGDMGGDEAGIRTLFDGFTAAWGKHDINQMASFWADDGDLINPQGKWGEGQAGVVKVFTGEQNGPLKKSTITFSIDKIRSISSDMAFVDGGCKVVGSVDKKGKKMPPMDFRIVTLAQKKDDQWQFVSVRPYMIKGKVEKMM
jgi:uncharacterized protein (TIGR02246 family)